MSFINAAKESYERIKHQQDEDLAEFELLEQQLKQENVPSPPESFDLEPQEQSFPSYDMDEDSTPWNIEDEEEKIPIEEEISHPKTWEYASSSQAPKSALVEKMFTRKGLSTPPVKKRETKDRKATSAAAVPPPPPPPPPPAPMVESNDQQEAKLPIEIEAKLKELEAEIEQYKKETKGLKRERLALEKDRKAILAERQAFEKYQEMEVEKFEKQMETERKKLATDRRVMERQVRARGLVPDRKERAEIEALKAQIVKLQLDEKTYHTKVKSNTDRLRQRISDLEKKNQELTESLQFMEKLRIETLEQPIAHETEDEYDPLRYSGITLPEHEEERHPEEYVEIQHERGKIERRYPDGKRTILYVNGTEKDIYLDGRTVIRFDNGDIKKTFPQTGLVVYYYAQAQTTHTTYPNGTQVFEFPNHQIERHYPNGSKEIQYQDGTIKVMDQNGQEMMS